MLRNIERRKAYFMTTLFAVHDYHAIVPIREKNGAAALRVSAEISSTL
jgi:hypothetical protein